MIAPGVITYCPVVITDCPAVIRACPAVVTFGQPVITDCPPVITNCQAVITNCPPGRFDIQSLLVKWRTEIARAPKSRAFAQLFQEFYIMVVAYIYFTRIAVFIVQNTLPCGFGRPLTTPSYGLYSATPLIFQNTFRVPREV